MDNTERCEKLKIKWYLRPVSVIMAILLLGPFAIPLVWSSPAFKKTHKVIITIIVALLTVWIIVASIRIYRTLLQEVMELQQLMK